MSFFDKIQCLHWHLDPFEGSCADRRASLSTRPLGTPIAGMCYQTTCTDAARLTFDVTLMSHCSSCNYLRKRVSQLTLKANKVLVDNLVRGHYTFTLFVKLDIPGHEPDLFHDSNKSITASMQLTHTSPCRSEHSWFSSWTASTQRLHGSSEFEMPLPHVDTAVTCPLHAATSSVWKPSKSLIVLALYIASYSVSQQAGERKP